MASHYKTLQTILEKVRDRSEKATYSRNKDDVLQAVLDNQQRLAEAMLIIGAVLEVIVDKQISVVVQVPPKDTRS